MTRCSYLVEVHSSFHGLDSRDEQEELLLSEKPLGQGGNECDFDDQSHQRLKGSKHRKWIVEQDIVPWKESTTMKAGHAEYKGTQRGEHRSNGASEEIVGCGKA